MSRNDSQVAGRAYLACIRHINRQFGKVLTVVETSGLPDNTIVILWVDHGWHLGESALWGKNTPFERADRSTLMIRGPGVSRAGTVCDALVEKIDLYPTLIEL